MSLRYFIDNKSRIGLLRKKITESKFVRIIEAHNGLSAIVGNDTYIDFGDGKKKEFDGFWESSLTDSASKGYPDIELVSLDSRIETINQILDVSQKPIIVDGDTGGEFNHFEYMVKRLERAGVSAVIIEDKIFPKRNSLEPGAKQTLEKPEIFAEKLRRGNLIKKDPDFMIIARLESLIAGAGLKDAVMRAKLYLEAGADGVMIHSKSQDPADVLAFAEKFYQFPKRLIKGKILVCVPTKYNSITDAQLKEAGFHIVIHANHQLRAAYKAMAAVCQSILINDRSFEADALCESIQVIFDKVGFLDVKEKDKQAAQMMKSKIKAIILAAGKSELSLKTKLPTALVEINGKTILKRQVESLIKSGLDNISVVKGYGADKYTLENINYFTNKQYNSKGIMYSLFKAKDDMDSPFVCLFSDVLFNHNIISSLLTAVSRDKNDIVLVVDDSYEHHRHDLHKKLDLVRTNRSDAVEPARKILDRADEQIILINKNLSEDVAHYEFIGISYFSQKGAAILQDVYADIMRDKNQKHTLSFTDIIQEVINRGYPVHALKTHKGWMEIHNEEDIAFANKTYKHK